MTKVIFDINMSLDGFMTAANRRPEEPMGYGGQRVHEWALADADQVNQKILEDGIAEEGAVIAGWETYESVPWWGAVGPTGPARRPVFVITHEAPPSSPEGEGSTPFVTDGIESALEQAKAAAGEKSVGVMGGASIGQQYLSAGLVDEISIHLVPVLFGAGTRMFENINSEHIQLETLEVINTRRRHICGTAL
jgi:dihydrofolate reductase